MMNKPLISVVIPTYKRPFKMIKRAINSVIDQTYQNIEILIIDDSPIDYLKKEKINLDIEKINDSRIKYIKHNKNLGANVARNTGINNAKGDYIAFLDDDDEWLPEKLELQMNKMLQDKEIGLVYCNSYTIRMKRNQVAEKKVRKTNLYSGWVYHSLIEENFIGSTSFVLIRKDSLENCGTFNETLKAAQDYELWLRISKKYKVDYVSKPLVNYYIHNGDRISTNFENKIQGLEQIIELNMDFLKKNPKTLHVRKMKIIPFYSIGYGKFRALLKWMSATKYNVFSKLNLIYLYKIFFNRI